MNYKIIKGRARNTFLKDLCAGNPIHGIGYENSVYLMMDEATTQYNGGSWLFLEFENGAKAMVLDDDLEKVWEIDPQPNFFEKPMTLLNLCIAINICVCSKMSFTNREALAVAMANNYHKLREVADLLPGGETIFGFID